MISRSILKKLAVPAMVLFLTACGEELTDTEHVQRAKDFQDQGDLVSAVIELKTAASINPDNPEARWLLGKLYVEIGDGETGEKELNKARELGVDYKSLEIPLGRAWFLQGEYQKILDEIKVVSNDAAYRKAKILTLRGDAHRDLGQYEYAEKRYKEAIEVNSEHLDAYVGMSRMLFRQNNLDEARTFFNQAEQREPLNSDVLLMKGDLLYALKDFSSSMQAYSKLLEQKKHNLRARLGLSLAQLADDRVEEAVKNLNEILKISPNHSYSNYLRGLAAFVLKDYQVAKNYTGKVLNETPKHLPSLLVSGASSFALAEYEQALSRIERVVAAAPGYEEARRLLGVTYQRLGNDLMALEVLKPLVTKDLDDATLLSQLGGLAARTGRIEEANEYLLRAASGLPENPDVRTKLGLTLLSMGQIEKGLSELSLAAEMTEGSGGPEATLIQALLKSKRYDQALIAAQELQLALPANSIGFVFAGIAHQKMGEGAKAQSSFERALEVNPGAQDAALNLAVLQSESGRTEEAKRVLEASLKENPESAEILTALARFEAAQKNVAGTRKYLEQLVEKYPNDNISMLVLARFYLVANEPNKAIDLLTPILEEFSEELAVLEVLGRAQLDAGDINTAAKTFEMLVQKAPGNAAAQYWLGLAYKRAGNPESASQAFEESVNAAPGLLEAVIELANMKLAVGNVKAAEELYRSYRIKYPANNNIILLGGNVALSRGDAEEAILLLSKAHGNRPAAVSALALSSAHFKNGDTDQAAKVLEDWLADSPKSAPALFRLNALYQATGRLSEARELIKQLVKLNDNNWIYHNELAMVSFKLSDTGAAIKHANLAYKLNADNPIVMDTYGMALMNSGEYRKAQRMFEKANDALPGNPEIQLHLAQSQLKNGDDASAIKILDALKTQELTKSIRDQVELALNGTPSER